MTRDQLDAIRARVDAALTYKPAFGEQDLTCPLCKVGGLDAQLYAAKENINATVMACGIGEGLRLAEEWVQNAPADMRVLLAEVERLKGARSEVNTAKLNDAFTEGTLKAGDAMRPLIADAFRRGVAAMREAAAKECWKASDELADIPDMESEQGTLQNVAYRIRSIPDPKDKP